LFEKDRRNIPTGMKRNGGLSAIGMAILPMRTALPYLVETHLFEKSGNLFGL